MKIDFSVIEKSSLLELRRLKLCVSLHELKASHAGLLTKSSMQVDCLAARQILADVKELIRDGNDISSWKIAELFTSRENEGLATAMEEMSKHF